jgi:hypothetical protein
MGTTTAQGLIGRGSGVFDNSLMFLTGAVNLTCGNAATLFPLAHGLKIRGTPMHGLAVRVLIPRFPGTTVSLHPTIWLSADDTTYVAQSQYPGGPFTNTMVKVAGSEVEVMMPFDAPRGFAYVKMGFAQVSGTTGDSWGAVRAGIVPQAHGDWTRKVKWG